MANRSLVCSLCENHVLQLGSFELEGGENTPIWVDLRQIIAVPEVLRQMAELMWSSVRRLDANMICAGTANMVPVATAMSLLFEVPLLTCDPSKGDEIVGRFEPQQKCVFVHDVLNKGTLTLHTLNLLHKQGLVVTDIVVFVDRQAGGKEHLAMQGYNVHASFEFSELMHEVMRLSS